MRTLAREAWWKNHWARPAIRSGSLVHEGGAASLIEAAYRYARHEPGVDTVLFGTGSAEHLKANIAAINKPALPQANHNKLTSLFGHLVVGVGLDSHQGQGARH